ncbi:hypothetical protein GH714_008090 [Hevea brasiliensis]|uniref:Uncharacterized protein n=1 Tax=Hevea brasiliensis TaxID=3981 RepID=A0A6A6M9N0_HEVBR|nr:hypothetical protein GH714_008090 [Hevea brasiliensis]
MPSFRFVNKSTAESSSPTKTIPPTKRFTWNEMQKQRAQGLCFNYDEKSQLDIIARDLNCLYLMEKLKMLVQMSRMTRKYFNLRFHSMHSQDGQLKRLYNNRMANVLHLPATMIKPFDVKVANGKPLTCKGKFDNVNILIQVLRQLKSNLHAANNRMKQQADSKRCDIEFQKKLGKTVAVNNELPLVDDDEDVLMEPEAVLDTRWVKKGSKFVEQS